MGLLNLFSNKNNSNKFRIKGFHLKSMWYYRDTNSSLYNRYTIENFVDGKWKEFEFIVFNKGYSSSDFYSPSWLMRSVLSFDSQEAAKNTLSKYIKAKEEAKNYDVTVAVNYPNKIKYIPNSNINVCFMDDEGCIYDSLECAIENEGKNSIFYYSEEFDV